MVKSASAPCMQMTFVSTRRKTSTPGLVEERRWLSTRNSKAAKRSETRVRKPRGVNKGFLSPAKRKKTLNS